MRRPLLLVNMLWLLATCRPSATTQPQPQPQPPLTPVLERSAAPASASKPEDPSAPAPAPGMPHTCEIELELLVPSDAKGHGTSAVSSDDAKQAAWVEACAAIRKSADLDCHDERHVGIISQQSTSMRSVRNTGDVQTRYEFALVLGARRTAKGFSDALEDRQQACGRAKEHACAQLVGGPCPDKGVRLIAVDGKPPRPAAVEPSPSRPHARPTI